MKRPGAAGAHPIPRMVDLQVVADLLDQPKQALIQLARRGEFPALTRISRTRYSVRLDEVREWMLEREVSKAVLDLERDYLMSRLPPGRNRRRHRAG